MKNDKFIAILGFAKRAGKIVYGYDMLKKARGVRLYVVSDSASANLADGMTKLALGANKPLVTVRALEADAGANTKALGITDGGMASGMLAAAGEDTAKYSILSVDGGRETCQTTRT